MQSIPRIVTPAPDESRTRVREIFFNIEKGARLSGKPEVLMRLDRIPGLVLGPANRISEGTEDAAMSEAYAALEQILHELELNKNKKA